MVGASSLLKVLSWVSWCLPFGAVQVFLYDGSGAVVKTDVAVLCYTVWQPAAQGVYPDRPAPLGRKGPNAAETAAGE